eukprot:m.1415901 g.1415901  ORF g.1415901 m.1415901 type:complete len:391 (+) comp25029_c0_seq103:2845-4017(+)
MCFMSSGDLLPGVEGCGGYLKPDKAIGAGFVGRTIKQIVFNTTRGGNVPGDDVYREYNVLFQDPPDNLAAEGFPVAVCNQGEGGGELYNRTSGIRYRAGDLGNVSAWTRPSDVVVHMMHNGWGNVMYRVAAVNASTQTLSFERGGYQHGRGGGVGDYFVENQLAFLDAPGEWYLDTSKNRLYLWPNATTSLHETDVVGATLESVVYVNGTQGNPVTNVQFQGVVFTQTAPTYLQPYERPISGDWAIHRGGTVFVTGANNITFSKCNFTFTGGNALMFSGHVKDSTVVDSEFFSVGDSAVVLFGSANWTTGSVLDDNYPSRNSIRRNLMHELGARCRSHICSCPDDHAVFHVVGVLAVVQSMLLTRRCCWQVSGASRRVVSFKALQVRAWS